MPPAAHVRGDAQDRRRRAEAGHHAHGPAGYGAHGDGLCMQVDGHAAHAVRDGVHGVLNGEFRLAEALFIVDVLLGLLGDAGHGLKREYGIFARGRLAGEHDGTGAVVDGVGHVGGLRAGGPGIVNHGFQHLCRGDHPLAQHAALCDQLFLDGGEVFKGDLHAHVAAADHDAGAGLTDFLDVLNARAVFNLGDQFHAIAASLVQYGLNVQQILLAGDEGAGDEIHAVLHAEEDVLPILLAHIGLREELSGKVHALAVGEHAAVDHRAVDVRVRHGFHPEGQQAVVHQYHIARLHALGQALEVHRDAAFVSRHVQGGKCKAAALLQRNAPLRKGADAVLRAFGVQHDGHGQIQTLAHALDALDAFQMLRMGAVGKVQAGDVHAGLAELGQDFLALAGGADGTDDLGLTHSIPPCKSGNQRRHAKGAKRKSFTPL